MERDNLNLRRVDELCAQSDELLDTLEELRATAQQLQVEAQAAQDVAQLTREASKRILRQLAASNHRARARAKHTR